MKNNNRQIKNHAFDLEDRTLDFAKRIIRMCKTLSSNVVNFKLIDQLIRSAGSIGANYREANDALSKKDFLMRMKIARKEAKETEYWLNLVIEANMDLKEKIVPLVRESIELKKILSAIITKSSNK
jgi:four helix bundle protein